jgi:nucleoid-associated protein YgaU
MGVLDKIFGNDDEKEKKPDLSDVRSNTPNRDVSGGGFGAAAGRAASGPSFSDVQSSSASTPAAPADATRTYTVVSGDSLSKIAKDQYGDAGKWQKIYTANKDTVSNPDLIHPGQVLNIPTDA